MPTIVAAGQGSLPNGASLSAAQTGNGASANAVDRGGAPSAPPGPALVKIVTTVGATPTCTYALECSPNGTDWLACPYADSATPGAVSVATFAITTAGTVWKILQANVPWRYFRVTYSANTNVTNTADIWTF